MNYNTFIKEVDAKLALYFEKQKDFICCQKRCSECCEKGDYPLSEPELRYLMQGFSELENNTKILVQKNIKTMVKGGKCPFLINKECSVYKYRPIICRIHGLAYLDKNGIVKLPYCANKGKNFKQVYQNGEFLSEPVKENLDNLIKLGEIRNLYDWLMVN